MRHTPKLAAILGSVTIGAVGLLGLQTGAGATTHHHKGKVHVVVTHPPKHHETCYVYKKDGKPLHHHCVQNAYPGPVT